MKSTSLLIAHVAIAVIITAIILLIYVAVQQSFRASANDPQIQIARDVSNALSKGKSINNFIRQDTIDLTQSLAVFTELFDKSGRPIQSSGLLNGQFLQPPQGIINYVNEHNEDILTWQPQRDVRMAMVFEKVNSATVGYAAVGRSLKEIEVRESNLVKMVLIVWLLCMGLLAVHLLIQNHLGKKALKK